MKISVLNFNSGEVSPKIDARADTEKYVGGCRQSDNMIPSKYGSSTRRPGTEFLTFSSGILSTFSYIVSYQNSEACYENEIVTTDDSDNMPDFICYENSIVCYENKPVVDSFSILSKYIVCYENKVMFHENGIVTQGI